MLRLFTVCVLLTCFVIASPAQDVTRAQDHTRNFLSVAPVQFTENGLGFGACYERSLDNKGMFAIEVPALVTFNLANTNRIYDYNTGNYSTGKPNAMYYAMPGIKLYPAGNRGRFRYAVGLAVVGGTGKGSIGYLNLYGLNTTEKIVARALLGGMLQNSLNIQAGKNVYAGLEIGIGTAFINKVDNKDGGSLTLVQGCFKIGYRF